ncbi:histone-lysine N-methyltransferase SUV39H2-like [Styela clava]
MMTNSNKEEEEHSIASEASEVVKTDKMPLKKIKPNSEMDLFPVVPVLFVQESLILEAAKKGLTVSSKYAVPSKYKKRMASTYANCAWFYSGKAVKKVENNKDKNPKRVYKVAKRRLPPSRKLLLTAHQTSALKMRKPNNMYEVEYIADIRIVKNQRYYLVKWVGWPEEANTWESSVNLSCHCLIKEFHEDYDSQLNSFFTKENLSWHKLLLGRNGIHQNTCTQRLFNAIPKSFKYLSTYGRKKSELRNQLKAWQDVVNESSQGLPYVVVENEVNMELPPLDFTYIAQNVAGNGVSIPDDPLMGCECVNMCDQLSGNCSCNTNGYSHQKPLYCDGLIKLKPGKPIYECNSRCRCGPDCPNRVIQKGSKYTLAIFQTPNGKGWGVKALQPIPKGAFVIEYVGEVITNVEAERRGMEYDSEGITYLFDLDYHETDNPMTVDATRFGNVSHFINHSCAPNLQVYNVFINNMDLSLPRIALFARKNINVNEELSFDYQMTGASEDMQDQASEEISDRQSEVSDTSKTSSILKKKCLCKASNCRGWLVM